MALFTDAEIIVPQDLLPFESSLLQVASTHGINVDQKITLAKDTVGEKLLLFLQDAGVSDPQWLSRRVIGLSTVVVTPPLKRWLCFESLTRFFAEAYNVQLNTRFQGKWTRVSGGGEARSGPDDSRRSWNCIYAACRSRRCQRSRFSKGSLRPSRSTCK